MTTHSDNEDLLDVIIRRCYETGILKDENKNGKNKAGLSGQ
jgi:hypothetical protein